MFKLLSKLKRGNYQPLNRIIVDRKQVIKNYQKLSEINENISIAPVLKSNAYGHGLLQIAPIIDQRAAPFICVDSLPEANILKKLGIKSAILVMGAISPMSLQESLPYHLTVVSKQSLEHLIKFQKNASIHLFVDTGMNREGVQLDELNEVLAVIKKSSLHLVGLMTHLAIATDKNHPLTKKQIINFKKAKELVYVAGFKPEYIHIGGSDALSWINADVVNTVRTGRLLYGVQVKDLIDLKPVLQLNTSIVQIKEIRKGEQVGYSGTFTAQKDTTIALLPIGYNDGVDRRLSNKGSVLIKGKECPIIGLISMNMTVADISAIAKEVELGDSVIIFSSNELDPNSIEQSATKAKTNPSDLLVGLHTGTRREVI